MKPDLKYVSANDVRLAYFEWGAPAADKPTLLFVHATGFHGRLWDYLIEQLGGVHCIALEQRGHGRSEHSVVDHWRTFGEDQAAFVRALGLSRLIGIGHSMGAHGMIDAAAQTGAFDRLLLLDPTVSDEAAYAPPQPPLAPAAEHPAAKRRAVYASVEEIRERLAGKSSFPHFLPRIFQDYCEHGMTQTEDGNFRLLCDPVAEAGVYASARTNGAVYDSARALQIPVTIVRAQTPGPDELGSFAHSPTSPGLVAAFSQGNELHWADCTHFIPMQRPDDVVALIRAELGAWSG